MSDAYISYSLSLSHFKSINKIKELNNVTHLFTHSRSDIKSTTTSRAAVLDTNCNLISSIYLFINLKNAC